MANKTKKEQLKNLLVSKGKVTAEQAEKKFGIKNLRARISEFRQAGWEFETYPTNTGKVKYVVVDRPLAV